jgi:hypothetical protein
MEVYTRMSTPFAMCGTHIFIKTDIQKYEKIDLGKNYFGILFKNSNSKLWHMALENCGALIGSDKSKTKLVKRTKDDVSSGDPKIMESQIEVGRQQLKQAKILETKEWFKKFRE